MRALAIALAVAAALPAGGAAAASSVSLNGVNIDGVTNQRFENCTVTIDGDGNVNIEAKGYAARRPGDPAKPTPSQVASLAAAPAPAGEAPLTRRYFLVTEQTAPGGTQFDVAVFINAKWIRELRSEEDQVVVDVTKYLRPGANRIVLSAQKRPGGASSAQRDATLKVVIGEGSAASDRVVIDRPVVEMKRSAAETSDVTEEFTLTAR